MTTPRLLENLAPSMVRNSLLTTFSGSCSGGCPGPPPKAPPLSYPMSMLGQMTEWKTMLSLPMK